ncbi:MAG TPA: molybdopterin-guanine dinucleotide biosynthesis protein B [Methanotrichaceae archaeon]|nr:molybdopterin-guanine dinucleotide biosynthesis protein B [Methanotrichaceae archaeon]
MKVIDVAGTKKTGKTTLVVKLVASLKRHGRVGTIKNMAGHPVDSGDTRRHFEAGADEVMGMGLARIKVTAPISLDSALDEMAKDGMDFVVVEGFKHSSLPKVALGDVEVENAVVRTDVSRIDDALVQEITDLVLNSDKFNWP